MALLTLLVARSQPGARIALPLTVPSVVEQIARENGATIVADPQRPALADEPGGERSVDRVCRRDELRIDLPRIPAVVRRDLRHREDHGRCSPPSGARCRSSLRRSRMACRGAQRAVSVGPQGRGDALAPRRGRPRRKRQGRDGWTASGSNGPDGWVLVLPHATEASVNVWAEGPSDDQAGRYADEIVTRVRDLAAG